MSRSQFTRSFLILVIVAAVSTPSAWGAPRRLPSEISPFDIFAWAWHSLAAVWSEAGCILDPHGGCATDQTDGGCGIDPHGGCATLATDEGCAIDPHGGCKPGS
jgi:hypothetical protein